MSEQQTPHPDARVSQSATHPLPHPRARAGLSVALVLLLTAGLALNVANDLALKANAAAPSASKPAAVASPTAPAPEATSTLPANLDQTKRGCNLALEAEAVAPKIGKCKILVVGDSLGNNLGWGMYDQLSRTEGITMYVRSKASTGLTKPSFYDWPAELKPMLGKYKPHLVVMMLGANDWQDMRSAGDRGNSTWRKTYKERIKRVTDMVTASGSYIMWVGLPVMRLQRYGEGMATLNSLYEATVPQTAGATFLPTWDFFADGAGRYRDYASVNGKRTKIRGSDGIHFSSIGQAVLGTFVIKQIRSTYNVEFVARNTKRITG